MSMSQQISLVCDMQRKRLDNFICEKLNDISRSKAKILIDAGHVLVNGSISKPSYIVICGDNIDITIPKPKNIDIIAQDIPIDIVFEDKYLAVINKQQGLTVHPSETQKDGTLVNALMYYIKDLSGINGELRPGIVHRLDKDTSGLLVIAKDDTAHKDLAIQIANKVAKRKYFALVHGNIKDDSGIIDAPIGRHKTQRKKMAVVIGGKRAITKYSVIQRFGDYTFVEFELSTGRTHQIRVHSKYIGHPVVGDSIYSTAKNIFSLKGQLLHSHYFSFFHPYTKQEMSFECNVPDYFQKVIDILSAKNNI